MPEGRELAVHQQCFNFETPAVVNILDVLGGNQDVFDFPVGEVFGGGEFDVVTHGRKKRNLVDEEDVT